MCTTATKFLKCNGCKLSPATWHATAEADAQREAGGKFEKGNFVNGNVWQETKTSSPKEGVNYTAYYLGMLMKHDLAGCSTNTSTTADRGKEALKRQ